jgi:WD40 repeat protein
VHFFKGSFMPGLQKSWYVFVALLGGGLPHLAQAGDAGKAGPRPLPPLAVARYGTNHFRTGGMVTELNLSPDGKKLVVGSIGGMFVFDAATGKRLLHVPGAGLGQVSDDGRRVVYIDKPGSLKIRDLAQNKIVKTIEAPGVSKNFALAPDDQTIALERFDSQRIGDKETYKVRLELRDLRTGKVLRSLGEETSIPGHILRFSPDNKVLYAISLETQSFLKKSLVRRFDTATGKLTAQFMVDAVTYIDLPAWDGKSLFAIGPKIWDLEKERLHWESKGALGAICAFMPGGKTVLGVPGKGRRLGSQTPSPLIEWDLETDRGIRRWNDLGGSKLVVSRDGKSVFGGSAAYSLNGILHWSLATGKAMEPDNSLVSPPRRLAFSADEKYLAVMSLHELAVFDRATARIVHRQTIQGTLLFTPESKSLICLGAGQMFVWEAGTWTMSKRELKVDDFRPRFSFPPHLISDAYFAVSPDGKLLAGAFPALAKAATREVTLWDLASGKKLGALQPPKVDGKDILSMENICFSPDGKRLACLTRVNTKKVPFRLQEWSVADRKLLHEMESLDYVAPLGFVEDGKFLAGGSRSGKISIWNVAGKKEVASFEAAGALVLFSPDGRLAAARHQTKGTVAVFWDLAGRKKIGEFDAQVEVVAMGFSPDGRFLAVSGTDSAVLMVDLYAWPAARPAVRKGAGKP